jgi:hypothetical protein
MPFEQPVYSVEFESGEHYVQQVRSLVGEPSCRQTGGVATTVVTRRFTVTWKQYETELAKKEVKLFTKINRAYYQGSVKDHVDGLSQGFAPTTDA